MKRLTAYVSGNVQKTGYRAQVADFARMLGLRGTAENLDDSRVKILAEGNEDKLKWFEEAININDNLIQVSSIESKYSEPKGDFSRFYKLVDKGETDSRLDTAASHLNNLIGAVNKLNENLGGKMDAMVDLQREALNAQENLLEEVQESRKDLKGYLEQRFEKLESGSN
jgi:acylphosphatase